MLSYREVTMALTLYTQNNVVISTVVWQFWGSGWIPEVSALGVVLILFALIAVGTVGVALSRIGEIGSATYREARIRGFEFRVSGFGFQSLLMSAATNLDAGHAEAGAILLHQLEAERAGGAIEINPASALAGRERVFHIEAYDLSTELLEKSRSRFHGFLSAHGL